MQTRIAVDLGASSGRVIVARITSDRIETDEVARFGNAPVKSVAYGQTRWSWDWAALTAAVIDGLHAAVAAHPEATSVGIDSWAVDYGLLDESGRLLADPVCYRDERGARGVELVHRRVPFDRLYPANGLQFLPFTTCYQLAADDLLDDAQTLLMIPDLLSHHLTGGGSGALTERTNASTTGLLDPTTGRWNGDLIGQLGFPPILTDLATAGQARARLTVPGLEHLELVTTASHDTAAAIAATPLHSTKSAYVSLGTWALVGLELDGPILTEQSRLANFTNEGGLAGTTRFLRNVMGTWLLSETLREWGAVEELPSLLAAAAERESPQQLIEVDDEVFLAPDAMATRISAWLAEHSLPQPPDRPAFVRLVVDSIAQAIAVALRQAAELAGLELDRVHVVGGGAQNRLLCAGIRDRVGVPVVAGPVEATALGNLLAQSGVDDRASLDELRATIVRSTALRRRR